MSIPLPTYAQVIELPGTPPRAVPPEFIDENGHMNIGRYLEVASHALWDATTAIGLGQTYIDDRGMSTFTAEHHLTYLGELLEGEEFSVHVRLLDHSDKVMHSVTFLVDRQRERLAFTCEATLVHVDMATRRPTPFPQDITAGLDRLVLEHNAVTWPSPVSGAMGIRRRS